MKTQHRVDVLTEDRNYNSVDVEFEDGWIIIETGEYDYDTGKLMKITVPNERVMEIRGVSNDDEV